MAVREFDSSVSDDLITAIGALSGMTYGTVGGIVQVADTGNLKTLLGLHDSGASPQVSFGLDFNEFNYWWVHGSERVEGQQLTVGTWYVWVVRKDTGNLTPRSSLRDMTAGTWDHGFVNNDVIDSTAPGSGGDTRFSAGGSNFFDGHIAIRAVWANSLPWAADLTGDLAIESAGLETAASNWDAANPSAGWVFDQSSTSESVSDFTGGGADQTSISGTTVITGDDPPGFSFDLGGGTPVGQATETDTAQPVTAAKTKMTGLAVESDLAQPVTSAKTHTLGLSTETDLAQPITASKTYAVGQASETDLAQPVALAVGTQVAQAVETDQVFAITAHKTVALGLAIETDTAIALGETPEPEPIVLPPFREQPVPDFQESAVPAYRETAVPAYQEAS